jgi:hypothetical protein
MDMRTIAAIFLLLSAVASGTHAGETLLVSGALSDPSMAAPLLHWKVTGDDGQSWRLGLTGWTMDGGWTKPVGAGRMIVLSAEATPIHAHNSNRMYQDGKRVGSMEYENSAYRVGAGIRFAQSESATAEASLVALYERIAGVDDPAVVAFWKRPYTGFELTHSFSRTTARIPLIAAFDGIETDVRVEQLFGRENWTRVHVSGTAARTFGRVHLRQSLTAMSGRSLNVVNRFLAGGSWDVLGGDAVYGSRYGEFRVRRAAIASSGADWLLPRHWRVGVRGSLMRSDVANTYGQAINASTTWRTFGFNFGVGKSQRGSAVTYASIVAPLYLK